ncbi:hypothetical protein DPMN_063009 [Dreissena polymorpha]|uniref:Uncharacterized protein n=1 Tax=Dreissena polymorpha TaxID=45954 RepID=A0A9D4C9P4_DREPO|nr:hypothetical protein DPMN_063009 [Dreissena polymorpha]
MRCWQDSDLRGKIQENFQSIALSWIPTADQINSIKPDQAIGYWSGSVGMSGRGRSGRSALVGLPTRYFLTFQKYRVAVEYEMDREALGKWSCISRVED